MYFGKKTGGQEFGGDNPKKLRELNKEYYQPYGTILGRAPKGRKGYQGRVERSHRTDDEEFYIPLLLKINEEKDLLEWAGKWIYWYNVKRPHLGKGMNGRPPLLRLKSLGYNLPEEFACLPPIILDNVSTFLAVRGGNNLLALYKNQKKSNLSLWHQIFFCIVDPFRQKLFPKKSGIKYFLKKKLYKGKK